MFYLEKAEKSQTESGDLGEFYSLLKPLLHFQGNVTN